jgi:hypothetical protein
MRCRRSWLVVPAWLLLSSRDPSAPLDDWKVVDRTPTKSGCEAMRDTMADEATHRELGALSSLDAQNPVRVAAYEKTHRRVSERYRCVED